MCVCVCVCVSLPVLCVLTVCPLSVQIALLPAVSVKVEPLYQCYKLYTHTNMGRHTDTDTHTHT